jgi:Gram-negative bacterial TonB protein C-terminal
MLLRDRTNELVLPRPPRPSRPAFQAGGGNFPGGAISSEVANDDPVANAGQPYRTYITTREEVPARSMVSSILLHAAFIPVLVLLSRMPASAHSATMAARDPGKIYYVAPVINQAKLFPRMLPAGPGGMAGRGTNPKKLPSLGNTVHHNALTVISNPSHPDNPHQTIIQANSPPELRIPQDLRLPNVLLGNPMPQLHAPLQNSQAVPKLSRSPEAVAADPNLLQNTQTVTDLKLAAELPSSDQPKLPVPVGNSGAIRGPQTPGSVAGAADGSSAVGNGLLVMGTNPDDKAGLGALVPGNRYGGFSIGSAPQGVGSPGGVVGGTPGAGTGGFGNGGDSSTGLGNGKSGGGGGGNMIGGPVSVKGEGGEGGGGEILTASTLTRPDEMVVPVINLPHIRRRALVVSSGPVGGGGLAVYKALTCGKIGTIFLPMEGGDWPLEYCAKDADHGQDPATEARSGVVQMDRPIIPPDPVVKFDFKRLPVPPDKVRKMIVLKGVIRTDGTVGDLTIYQGVLPTMDEAAKLAFSKWNFNPALREGKPVEIEVLVGLPAVSKTQDKDQPKDGTKP